MVSKTIDVVTRLLVIMVVVMCLQCGGYYHSYAAATPNNHSSTHRNIVNTLLVFGDSTVDPGNNNYIPTLFKGDFPPYGVGFEGSEPTGRFTDGRLATDFLVSYLGIKEYIPPYLDPSLRLEDMITGVSFASAGTGYDPLTSTNNKVISMSRQLEYLEEYRSRLEGSIGKKKARDILKKAVYTVSCGTNDITESRPLSHRTDLDYVRYLVDLCKNFVQGLVAQGAKNIVVVGLPPAGCLPIVITLNGLIGGLARRECVDSLSSIAWEYNRMIQQELKSMQLQLHIAASSTKRKTEAAASSASASSASSASASSAFAVTVKRLNIVFVDIYQSLDDQMHNPAKYGFEVVDRGCCGTGFVEGAILCNPGSFICDPRSEYLFWDAIHPTEKAYKYVFDSFRSVIDSELLHLFN